MKAAYILRAILFLPSTLGLFIFFFNLYMGKAAFTYVLLSAIGSRYLLECSKRDSAWPGVEAAVEFGPAC